MVVIHKIKHNTGGINVKNATKRMCVFFVLAAMLVSAVTSCSSVNDENSPKTADGGNESVNESTTETEAETDAYGREIIGYPLEEGLNFDGYKIKMIARNNPRWLIDFGVEDYSGDGVNDAIYDRNLAVESKLGVVLEIIPVAPTNTEISEAVGDMVRENFTAGDTAYDVAAFYQFYGGPVLATSGALKNMLTLPYVDFEKPWWNHSFSEELTYNDQLYYAIGDMNVSVTSMLMGVFFNQQKFNGVYDDFTVLYDTVKSGKWTFDTFKNYVEGCYIDLDGVGKRDAEDFYGLMTAEDDKGPWLAAFNIKLCTKDESGTPQLSFFSERTVDAYNKIYDFYLNTPDVYFGAKGYDYVKAFMEEKTMFAICKFVDSATTLREMESLYGVLPMPKYDETQDTYHNRAHDNSNLMGVVQNTVNPEAVGAALELMNYYSYLSVTPAYFEVAMKAKYFADSESAEMFDMIRDGTIVDFGQVYSLAIGGGRYDMLRTYHVLARNMIRQKKSDLTSQYKRNEKIYTKCLEEILARYRELGKTNK